MSSAAAISSKIVREMDRRDYLPLPARAGDQVEFAAWFAVAILEDGIAPDAQPEHWAESLLRVYERLPNAPKHVYPLTYGICLSICRDAFRQAGQE